MFKAQELESMKKGGNENYDERAVSPEYPCTLSWMFSHPFQRVVVVYLLTH